MKVSFLHIAKREDKSEREFQMLNCFAFDMLTDCAMVDLIENDRNDGKSWINYAFSMNIPQPLTGVVAEVGIAEVAPDPARFGPSWYP